jgi:hypothetical protein
MWKRSAEEQDCFQESVPINVVSATVIVATSIICNVPLNRKRGADEMF